MNSMTKKPEPIPDPTSDGFAPNGTNRKAILNRNILDAAPAKLLSIIATKVEVIRQIAMNWSGLQPFLVIS